MSKVYAMLVDGPGIDQFSGKLDYDPLGRDSCSFVTHRDGCGWILLLLQGKSYTEPVPAYNPRVLGAIKKKGYEFRDRTPLLSVGLEGNLFEVNHLLCHTVDSSKQLI